MYFTGTLGVFCKGCWLKRKWMFKALYFKLKWFLYQYWSKRIRVFLVALFSHVIANTGRIHIHVALTGKRERGEGEDIFFFPPPPLFLHLSLNKNTPNPFSDMLRIRSNRLFFFLSLCISGYKRNASRSLFLSHINTHAHTRERTRKPVCARARFNVMQWPARKLIYGCASCWKRCVCLTNKKMYCILCVCKEEKNAESQN